MSSTSQKHRNFVAEPMGEKPVSHLAGVGDILGKRLEAAGFDRVRTKFYFMSNFLVCLVILLSFDFLHFASFFLRYHLHFCILMVVPDEIYLDINHIAHIFK